MHVIDVRASDETRAAEWLQCEYRGTNTLSLSFAGWTASIAFGHEKSHRAL